MMVEVLELDFQGWKCGDIGKRQGKLQDKDTKVGDLWHEWEWHGLAGAYRALSNETIGALDARLQKPGTRF